MLASFARSSADPDGLPEDRRAGGELVGEVDAVDRAEHRADREQGGSQVHEPDELALQPRATMTGRAEQVPEHDPSSA